MNDLAEQMDKILKSANHKSLFNDYKKASDENSAGMMEPGPNVNTMDKEEQEPFFMAKYPNMMQLLELLKAEEKFPTLMAKINAGEFNDVSGADDKNYATSPELASEVASLNLMIDILNDTTLQSEFNKMIDDLDLPATGAVGDKIPEEEMVVPEPDAAEDLVVSEDLEGMGDMPVSEEPKAMDHVAADLAIDSLLNASAALDKLNFANSSQNVLKLASMIVAAKKSKKDDEDKKDEKCKGEDDKKSDKKEDDKKSDKEDKKSDKKDKDDKKSDKKEDKKSDKKEDKKDKKDDDKKSDKKKK